MEQCLKYLRQSSQSKPTETQHPYRPTSSTKHPQEKPVNNNKGSRQRRCNSHHGPKSPQTHGPKTVE